MSTEDLPEACTCPSPEPLIREGFVIYGCNEAHLMAYVMRRSGGRLNPALARVAIANFVKSHE